MLGGSHVYTCQHHWESTGIVYYPQMLIVCGVWSLSYVRTRLYSYLPNSWMVMHTVQPLVNAW